MESWLEDWRGKLVEFVTHPSDHVGFWIAVFVVLAFLMVAARGKKG